MNKPIAFMALVYLSFISVTLAASNENPARVSLELSGMPVASNSVQVNGAGLRLELVDGSQDAPEGVIGSSVHVFLGCFGPAASLFELTITVEWLRAYLLGQIVLTEEAKIMADMNYDGRIDIADIVFLLNRNSP